MHAVIHIVPAWLKQGVSADTLRYLTGYADIAATCNVNTHKKYEGEQKEIKELEDRFKSEETGICRDRRDVSLFRWD